MAQESDRNILTGLLQTGLDISLGAASKSIEMIANPPEAVSRMVSEMQSMLTLPADSGPELQDKAKAMAGVWLQKGAGLMAEFKAAGEKITNGK